MTDDVMAAVRKLLIKVQGVPEAEVTPHARLLHDLGVDGEDAGEIFQALHEQFGTDFTELNHQWRIFFNTEGSNPKAILFGIPAIMVCGGVAGALVATLHWPRFLTVVFALGLFVSGSWLIGRWFGRELHPLTVGGLAEIVRVGRWPANPNDVG
ncbi:acyl carrier protein [Sphingomonas sp. MMS24-J13]|uniref:acyl carrier protein n=1 Tax=Sphingomonas sp. MMS24-J13 TaxID=3238686 RepID=UPI00384E2422